VKRIVRWLDLKGTDENPAFSKIAWWALFIAFLATGNFGILPATLLGAMAFGRSTIGQFFASKK
jgi:hypothetical protein